MGLGGGTSFPASSAAAEAGAADSVPYTYGGPGNGRHGRVPAWAQGHPFGGMGGQPMKGQDLIYELPVSLEEIFHGAEKMVSYRRGRPGGKGLGKGSRRIPDRKKAAAFRQGRTRPGRGPCPAICSSRCACWGTTSFHRDGDNLVVHQPVSFSQAALGSVVEIKTLDNKELSVKVPARRPAGPAFKAEKARGFSASRARAGGDLHRGPGPDSAQKAEQKAKGNCWNNWPEGGVCEIP